MTKSTLFAFSLTLCAAGCLGQPGDDDLDPGVAQPELTRSGLTVQDPWVVGLDAGGHHCTGNVLTQHWILTAAHCATVAQSATLDVSLPGLPSTPGGPVPLRHLYHGSAHYYPNPDWNPTCPLGVCVDTDADDDIGLVELTGGAIDLSSTGTALLFDDDEEPYHGAGDRSFRIVGTGLGTDPGGSDDCDDGVQRGKRVADGFTVDVSDDDYQAHAPYGAAHPCPGDSGSPWLFPRGPAGAQLDLVFGVMSSLRPDTPVTSPKMWAALVKPRRAWIQSTAAATDHPLFTGTGTVGSWTYRRYSERPIILPPLPPPPIGNRL